MPLNGITKNLQLREIAPSDLEEVARFILNESGADTPLSRALERLSWILLENPARVSGDPLGWLLRASSGKIVGCMCCAPQKFCIGQVSVTLTMANGFYVNDEYRGSGASIFLKYLQIGRQHPLFVSSASPAVAAMWQRLGGYPLGNSEREIFGVVRWPQLLAESVYRKTASDRLAQLTAALMPAWIRAGRQILSVPAAAGGELLPVDSPEEAARICAQHHSEKITNCRDLPFLRWRYFSKADVTTRVFAFRPQKGEKQFMVAVRLQNRGYKNQITALHVLDIWGESDAKLCLAIASSLWRKYLEQIDMLVFRCLNPAQMQALTVHGFRLRSFPAPIAWCIDKYELLPSKEWYFVPADGDMFL